MSKNAFEDKFERCRIACPLSGRVILASNSPRRRELLSMIVPKFEIDLPNHVDESYPSDLPSAKVPEYLSRKKSEAYSGHLGCGDILITADTVVIVDGDILGKPRDYDDAAYMLHRLSGRTHDVVTGVTLRGHDRTESFSSLTRVSFAELGDEEIDEYIRSYKPFDKAGAYGIQEWIGAVAISRIDGSFYNVMGLPVHALYRRMQAFR